MPMSSIARSHYRKPERERHRELDEHAQRWLLRRICGEYHEMAGLALSQAQAQRLFGLDAQTCSWALHLLVQQGFLSQNRGGAYVHRDRHHR